MDARRESELAPMKNPTTVAANLTDPDTVWRTSISPWDPRAPKGLVTLLADGEGSPLYCVHWGNGNIRFFAEVANVVSGGRPVLGFEAAGYRGSVRPFVSIAQMAERHVLELRAVQPHGPYHLCGLCQGGLVAYEMAQRLRDQGEEVGVLALVNVLAPAPILDPGWGLNDLYRFRLASLRTRFGLEDLVADVPKVMAQLRELRWMDDDIDPDDFYRLQVLWAAGMFAQDHYEARTFDGPVLLFQWGSRRDNSAAHWTGLVGDASKHWFDADSTLPIVLHPLFADVMSQALRLHARL